MIGLELNDIDFDNLLVKVDELLKKSPEFTSLSYTGKSLKTVNGLWFFAKPDREDFIELLKPLNLNWQELEILIDDELV
jgi:hypothetical protein